MKFTQPVLFFTTLFCAGVARGQEKPLKIEPDTPDFTIGTSTTPQGHFQTETRVTAQRHGETHEYGLGETLLRYGVLESAEIRVGVPSYLISRENGRMAGYDDATLEAKIRLFEGSKSQYGILVDSILPTGARRVVEHKYQPGLTLTSSFTLTENLEFLGNLGVRRASANNVRFSQYIGSTSLRYDVTPKTKIYSEVYGFNRMESSGRAQKFLALGAVHLLGNRTAFDVRVGSGLKNHVSGPDYFYEVGLSRLF